MGCPKIKSAKVLDERNLLIELDNHRKKRYNINSLLEKENFCFLKNFAFFKSVRVEQGGYAVSWNDRIDISEYELWNNGENLP